jgi:hypothetical protein
MLQPVAPTSKTSSSYSGTPGGRGPQAAMLAPAESHAPSRRDLAAIGLAALAIRLALFLAATQLSHWSLDTFANLHDGSSYLRIARSMLDASSVVAHIDRRVFIGYPALIALLGAAHIPLNAVALAVSWLSGVVATVFTALLFRDKRIGWALVLFPPSFLVFSTLVMSEALLLALIAVGTYLVLRRNALVLGGLALGYAGVVRPVACFAVAGLLALFIYRRQLWRAVVVGGVAAAVVLAGFLALRWWRGDALEGVKIYANNDSTFAGRLFEWPFESVIMTPFRTAIPVWDVVYTWAYLGLVIGACALVLRKVKSSSDTPASDAASDQIAVFAAVWLLGNTAFVACMGNVWGFHYFDRHILAALPPLMWAYRKYYPRGPIGWGLVGVSSLALALRELLVSVA